MLRLGRYALYLAAVLVAVGLVAGFGALFMNYDKLALLLLSLAPIGMIVGFAGLALVVLTEPRDRE